MFSSPEDVEYGYLEEVLSERSLSFARSMNERTLSLLGDPTLSPRYAPILEILESTFRIPHVSRHGTDSEGDEIVFNFWKDGSNPRGIYRRTTLASYRTASPHWVTVLDVDALGRSEGASWVWKGLTSLPKRRDAVCEEIGRDLPTRGLVKLSDGGADAVVLREFDFVTGRLLDNDDRFAFHVHLEAKTRASYKSRDVLLIGTEVGENAMTDSGYPRTVREWTRGTKLEDAPVVFEGEKTDISVFMYIDDQRFRGGGIYEFQYRSMTFYTKQYFARKIHENHLLPINNERRMATEKEPDFIKLDVPEDAQIGMYGDYIMLTLRTDWTINEKTYKTGSFLMVPYDELFQKSLSKDSGFTCNFQVLFEPNETTFYEGYSATANYIILSVIESVKSRLLFFQYDEISKKIVQIGGDATAAIRTTGFSALDPESSDLFWFTTSTYDEPTTLYLADASMWAATKNKDNELFPAPYVIEKLKGLPNMYDSTNVSVRQQFATSKDGTKVPYFLICPKGAKMDGNTPTLLYGYGGFEISMTPNYIANIGKSWIERGGAYVVANIRGGGEFGPAWHQAALKENRNKAFEDFVAVGEDLCQSGLCRPSTLACRGGSNGGLLTGMMLVSRPDLFGAIHCAVPLLDMRRFHTLLAGASWAAEYGSGEEDWEKFLHKYSPYHLIDENAKYPPIIFTTSTRDDRVHPAHARKMVKKLMDLGKGAWPIYYYENIEGGHGGAADAKQQAFMQVLSYDFLWDTLCEGRDEKVD